MIAKLNFLTCILYRETNFKIHTASKAIQKFPRYTHVYIFHKIINQNIKGNLYEIECFNGLSDRMLSASK